MRNEMTVDRHVIVVDDEPMFLRFASIPFRTGFCGFCTWNVHAFTEPAQALDFYKQNSTSVDVVITDFNMPGMNGTEFIQAIRSTGAPGSANVPTVIVSSDPPQGADVPASTKVVRKPYTKDDIARCVCDASLVCETAKCPGGHLPHPKPKPNPEGFRIASADGQVTIYG